VITRRRLFSLIATWTIPILGVVTLALGLQGWLSLGTRFDEAAFRAMTLFDIGSNFYIEPPGSSHWQFLVGRWTGAVVVFGAGFYAVAALFQERLAVAIARYIRQDVVVIGQGQIAAKAFETTREAGKRVLWLGSPNPVAYSLRTVATPWVAGDRVKAVGIYAAQADTVLIAGEDDAAAMVLARAARRSAPKALITVLMEDTRLAESAAAALNDAGTRVMSAGQVAARALNTGHPPFLIAWELGQPQIHALIVGFGQTGQAIARDLIINCRTTYLGLPGITVIDPEAESLEGVLRVQAPEIDQCAQLTFVEGRVGSQAIMPDAERISQAVHHAGPLTCAYICLDDDSECLAAAAMLQSLLRASDVDEPPIFVRLHDDAAVASGQAARGLNAIVPFGDLDDILAASEFLSRAPDSAARAYCEAYRASLPPAVRNDPSNGSARPWDQLEETFRQANRDAVAHIPAKLASAGIDPTYWRGVAGLPRPPADQRLFTTDDECERLAELEHERWNAQRRMDGWRWAVRRLDSRRQHPSLLPFERLPEDTKEYDRVFIRQTQSICWGGPLRDDGA
jgi:hypothetical protein